MTNQIYKWAELGGASVPSVKDAVNTALCGPRAIVRNLRRFKLPKSAAILLIARSLTGKSRLKPGLSVEE